MPTREEEEEAARQLAAAGNADAGAGLIPAPAPLAVPQAFMLPQSEMSRLIQFKGTSKDTVTAEAWAEMVDRHITVLKWSPEQTAGPQFRP